MFLSWMWSSLTAAMHFYTDGWMWLGTCVLGKDPGDPWKGGPHAWGHLQWKALWRVAESCDLVVNGPCIYLVTTLWVRGFQVAQMVRNLPAMQETQVTSLDWEDPWRRERQPIRVFLPGEFHGQRRLVGYGPWGCRVRHNWVIFTFTLWDIWSSPNPSSSRKNNASPWTFRGRSWDPVEPVRGGKERRHRLLGALCSRTWWSSLKGPTCTRSEVCNTAFPWSACLLDLLNGVL